MRLRPVALASVAAALVAVAPAAATTYAPGAPTYDFAVRVAGPALTGTGTIGVRNDGAAPMRDVWLRLWGNDAYGCAAPAVRVRVTAGGVVAQRALGCTALRVRLGQPIPPGGTGEVGVSLRAVVDGSPWRTGSWGRTRAFGGVLPTVAPLVDGTVRLDPPSTLGDSWTLLAGAWKVQVTAPTGTVLAATGTDEGPRPAPTGWAARAYDAPHAREFMIVTGPLRVTRGEAAGVPVRVFARPGTTSAMARRMLAATERAMTAFSDRYGPYPGTHLDVVLAGPDGMEYPDVVLSEASAETVTHEVAHQWFAQEVGASGYRTPWIDETFTTYAQMRLLDLTRDCDVAAPLADYRPARLSWTLGTFSKYPDRLYQAVYDGGACAFEGIGRAVGAERFDEILREWVDAHRWGNVDTADWLAFLGERVPAPVVAAFRARTGL